MNYVKKVLSAAVLLPVFIVFSIGILIAVFFGWLFEVDYRHADSR